MTEAPSELEDFNRIRLSKSTTNRLSALKGRTGLRPNILCRLALCVSLTDPRPPSLEEHEGDGMEINRYSLTGPYDALFLSLLRERCAQDGRATDENLYPYLLAHINRGVTQLSAKLKDLSDLSHLIPQSLEEWDLGN